MDNTITTALSRTGANLLKTGVALVVTTIASNKLRDESNNAIRSVVESYNVVKETLTANKRIGS